MRLSNQSSFFLKDIIILSFILTILFGAFLGSRVWQAPDEGRYVEIPREMIVAGDYVTPRLDYVKYFEKPILFYWLQAGAIKLFGFNEWSTRLVTALMALLGCLMTYVVGAHLYSRMCGWLSSLVLATSGLYFFMAHTITTDMTLSVLLTGSLFSFLMGVSFSPGKVRDRYMWSMYIFAALATLTKGLIGIIFPGMIIFLWVLFCNEWRSIKTYCLPTGIILLLIIILPWHILAQIRNHEFFQFYVIDEQFLRYFTVYAKRDKAFWFLSSMLLLSLMPWVAFLYPAIRHSFFSWRQRLQYKEILFLFIWPIVIFLFYQFSKSQLPTYLIPVFPPLAIFLGRYLADALNNKISPFWLKFGFGEIILLSFISGLLVLFIPHLALFKNYIAISTAGYSYLLAFGIMLIIGTVLGSIAFFQNQFKATFLILLISTSVFFITINLSINTFDYVSIEPLAKQLKPLLRNTDEVFTYNHYYQDLPPYIRRKVSIVNWWNELNFGIHQENTSKWIINEKTLWQRWNSSRRKFMIMDVEDYARLMKDRTKKIYFLGKTQENVLVTNLFYSKIK